MELICDLRSFALARQLDLRHILRPEAGDRHGHMTSLPQLRKAKTAIQRRTATPPPDGLDLGPLPQLLGYALRRAQIAVFADFHASFAPLDLRPAQFSLLALIDGNPGCKQSDAADALGIMQPNFVALMDELERRGLARRTPAKSDRRSYALELTTKGRTTLKQALSVVAEHEARVNTALTQNEARQLLDLLARVEQGNRPPRANGTNGANDT